MNETFFLFMDLFSSGRIYKAIGSAETLNRTMANQKFTINKTIII